MLGFDTMSLKFAKVWPVWSCSVYVWTLPKLMRKVGYLKHFRQLVVNWRMREVPYYQRTNSVGYKGFDTRKKNNNKRMIWLHQMQTGIAYSFQTMIWCCAHHTFLNNWISTSTVSFFRQRMPVANTRRNGQIYVGLPSKTQLFLSQEITTWFPFSKTKVENSENFLRSHAKNLNIPVPSEH